MLKRKVELNTHETIASFCSRVARTNGTNSAAEFAHHFRFSFDDLRHGTTEAVEAFCDLVGMSVTDLKPHTLTRRGKIFSICGHQFSPDALLIGNFRCCPKCLMEDLDKPLQNPTMCFGRMEWLLRSFRACPTHATPIAVIPTHWTLAGDFCAQFDKSRHKVSELARKAAHLNSTPLQSYIIKRLYRQSHEPTWLDSFSLQAAVHFTELLGSIIRHGVSFHSHTHDSHEQLECGRDGFSLVKQGEPAVRHFLCETVRRERRNALRLGENFVLGQLSSELWERFESPGYLRVIGLVDEITTSDEAQLQA